MKYEATRKLAIARTRSPTRETRALPSHPLFTTKVFFNSLKELAVSIRIWLMKVKSGVLLLEQFDIFRGGDGEDAAYRFTANFDEKTGKFRVISKKRSIEGEGDCRVGIHLINNAVMLSETKHLWSTPLGIGPRLIRDGKPGLADFVRCVAASLRSE